MIQLSQQGSSFNLNYRSLPLHRPLRRYFVNFVTHLTESYQSDVIKLCLLINIGLILEASFTKRLFTRRV